MSNTDNQNNLSRRNFLRLAGLGSTALCLGLYMPESAEAKVLKEGQIYSENLDVELCAWIIINTSGLVTIVSHRAEMGQGAYHSIAQIVAEELEVDLYGVDIKFAPGDQEKYGNQVTGGSSTIRTSYKNLLKLSATARELLIIAAASRWKVLPTDCYAEMGHVINRKTGKKFHYGELVEEASGMKAPENIKLKKISEYKLIRKPLHRRDTPLKTNGAAVFGLDKKLPGMLYAAVERNPRLRGIVKSYDDSEALKIKGVKRVFKVKMGVHNTFREGVAVVADSTWAAMQGKKALRIVWDDSGFEHINSATIFKRQEEFIKTKEGLILSTQGNPNDVIKKAKKKLDIVYQTPYQAHYCMEPVNCVAHFQGDKVEIWGPIQAPDWVQDYISKELKIERKSVIVNPTFLGGGFGRKAFMDYPHEATMISKEMGTPIQVVWTREDDATQGPYRPGISYRCEGVIDNGEISALKFRMAGQNNDHWRGGKKDVANRSTSEGFLKPYFDSIKSLSFAEVPFETPVPTMWWRSVYASTNGFAYESFLDEVAVEAKTDPLDLRRKYLKDERSQNLIDKMEAISGWKNRKKNEGFGVAITECFKSTVGQIVKVSRNASGKLKIDKVWAVMDCGWYVNPDIIRAQVEGSIVMGYGAAAFHEVHFDDGMVVEKNFHSYQMPRINDIPEIEIHIMENEEDAGGVGEPGLPAFAPALTNAIFDLTGTRIRKLPFDMAKI
ncbi:molybdopterin cofactor-binding domain-containing protein [Flavobacterium qiangtangense]|uniref:Molybdopterin cofactor-binding domain-containing protein n=1 Tax=Flavobacterium qiangtangense TaxID=1442595 RepID=A0ABW1PKR1_9FLAO